jgi:uncharacterized membrane protein YhiD involved in acid resistance
MNKFKSFEEFFSTQSVQISEFKFFLSIVAAILLGAILEKFYIKYGRTISNRVLFARNFPILILSTTFVISVVKSSLALSLGLVGALSIVRFRTAIKEPEELAVLFFCIAVGLGLGAGEVTITLIAYSTILIFLFVRARFSQTEDNGNMHISVTGEQGREEEVISCIEAHTSKLSLKRFDISKGVFEAMLLAEFDSFADMLKAKEALTELDPQAQVKFIETNQLI